MRAAAAVIGEERGYIDMETWIYQSILYTGCVLEIYLLFCFMKMIFPVYEERRGVCAALTAGCAAAVYGVNHLGSPWMNLICALFLCECYIWLVFRTGWRQNLLYLIFYVMLMSITEFLFLFVYDALGIDLQTTDLRRACVLMMEKLLEFVIIQVIRSKHHYLSGTVSGSKVKSLFIQPLSAWLLLNGIVIWGQPPFDRICIFSGGILSVVSNIVDFALVDRLLEAEHAVQENELVRLKADLEQKHYQRMEAVNREYAGYLHEMRHIVRTIRQFSGSDDPGVWKDLAEEASVLLDKKSLLDTRIYLKDPIVNAVLMERARMAQKKKIRYEVAVQPGIDLHFLEETDKIRIFGNLIDNALEAAERCTEGYVRIDLHMENPSLLILKIANSFLPQPHRKGKPGLTTKEDPKKHGFGLKHVEGLADKYHGLLDITEEKEEFTALLALSKVQNPEKK